LGYARCRQERIPDRHRAIAIALAATLFGPFPVLGMLR